MLSRLRCEQGGFSIFTGYFSKEHYSVYNAMYSVYNAMYSVYNAMYSCKLVTRVVEFVKAMS